MCSISGHCLCNQKHSHRFPNCPLRGACVYVRCQKDPGDQTVHVWKTAAWWQILPRREWGSLSSVLGMWWWPGWGCPATSLQPQPQPCGLPPNSHTRHPLSNHRTRPPPPSPTPVHPATWNAFLPRCPLPIHFTLSHEWNNSYKRECPVWTSVLPPAGCVPLGRLLNLPVPQHSPL